jgi:hypothetical protein
MKFIVVYQILVHADDIRLLWADINTIKRNTEAQVRHQYGD